MEITRYRRLFLSALLLSGVLFFQMTLYVIHLMLGLPISYNVFQFCLEMVKFFGVPLLSYFMNGLVLFTYSSCLWMIVRQAVMFGRTMRKLKLCLDRPMTEHYGKAHQLNGNQFMVISHSMPVAVTMGLLKPRIVISSGLLSLMEEDEIEAVIEHEKYHLRHKDPLQMFLLSMLSVSMWYIPIFKWLSEKYNLIIELMADKHAISKVGKSDVLGSALLKILKQGPLPVLTHSHASFAETSINVRIVHILDPHTRLSIKLPILRSVISMIAAFLLLLAVTAP